MMMRVSLLVAICASLAFGAQHPPALQEPLSVSFVAPCAPAPESATWLVHNPNPFAVAFTVNNEQGHAIHTDHVEGNSDVDFETSWGQQSLSVETCSEPDEQDKCDALSEIERLLLFGVLAHHGRCTRIGKLRRAIGDRIDVVVAEVEHSTEWEVELVGANVNLEFQWRFAKERDAQRFALFVWLTTRAQSPHWRCLFNKNKHQANTCSSVRVSGGASFGKDCAAPDNQCVAHWDCAVLTSADLLQVFGSATGPSGAENEIAKLDLESGAYTTVATYDTAGQLNGASYWRDDSGRDRIFATERVEEVNFMTELCPDGQFIRRAVLPGTRLLYVGASKNSDEVFVSVGGRVTVTKVHLAEIANTVVTGGASPYTSFDLEEDATGSVADIAYHANCDVFIGIQSDGAVVTVDYESRSWHTTDVGLSLSGKGGFGACYSFSDGKKLYCSYNKGGLYEIELNEETCVPTKATYRVATVPGSSNDGTNCRFEAEPTFPPLPPTTPAPPVKKTTQAPVTPTTQAPAAPTTQAPVVPSTAEPLPPVVCERLSLNQADAGSAACVLGSTFGCIRDQPNKFFVTDGCSGLFDFRGVQTQCTSNDGQYTVCHLEVPAACESLTGFEEVCGIADDSVCKVWVQNENMETCADFCAANGQECVKAYSQKNLAERSDSLGCRTDFKAAPGCDRSFKNQICGCKKEEPEYECSDLTCEVAGFELIADDSYNELVAADSVGECATQCQQSNTCEFYTFRETGFFASCSHKYNYGETRGVSCGVTGDANYAYIADAGEKRYLARDNSQTETAFAESCEALCSSSQQCNGFNLVLAGAPFSGGLKSRAGGSLVGLGACYFLKDATVGVKADSQRNCYVKQQNQCNCLLAEGCQQVKPVQGFVSGKAEDCGSLQQNWCTTLPAVVPQSWCDTVCPPGNTDCAYWNPSTGPEYPFSACKPCWKSVCTPDKSAPARWCTMSPTVVPQSWCDQVCPEGDTTCAYWHADSPDYPHSACQPCCEVEEARVSKTKLQEVRKTLEKDQAASHQ